MKKPIVAALVSLAIFAASAFLAGRDPHPPAALLALADMPTAEASLFADGFDSACWMSGKPWVKRESLSYGVYPAQRPNLDSTLWDNVWGYNNTYSTRVDWPGVGGASPVNIAMPANGFTCRKFTYHAGVSGGFSNPSFVAGPNTSQDIVMGNGRMTTPGCIAQDVPTSDANMVQYKGTPNNPTGSCNLVDVTTYYVRQWFTRPADCAKPNCVMGSVSYHN